jgi:hypothetical protein
VPKPKQKRLEKQSQPSSTTKESRNTLSKNLQNKMKFAVTKVCKACRRSETTAQAQQAKEVRLLNIIRYCTSKTGIDPFIRSSLELDAPELLAEHNKSMHSINENGGSNRIMLDVNPIPAPPGVGILSHNDEMRERQPEVVAGMAEDDAHVDSEMAQSAAVIDDMPFASLDSGEYFALSDEQKEEIEGLMLEWQKDEMLSNEPVNILLQAPVQGSRTTPEFFPELINSGLV